MTYAAKKAAEYPYYVDDGSEVPGNIQHGERNRNFIRKEQVIIPYLRFLSILVQF